MILRWLGYRANEESGRISVSYRESIESRPIRLIGYIRVSRVAGREGDTFISPTVQRERIEQLARAHGHTVVEWIEDLDQPGSRYERPGFQQALRMVEQGEADGIGVAKLDRFARSVTGAAQALDRLEKAGGTLLAVDLGMDTSTPAGKLMRNVLMALAEFDLDRIRDNWNDARTHAVTRGVHIGKVPVGYQRQPDGTLAPHPVEGPVIVELFERRAAGQPWAALCRFLDEQLPRPDGVWPLGTVTEIIVGRRTYLGESRQRDLVNTEAFEPLIPLELWEAAQPTTRRLPSRATGSLLAGLIRCAGCGYLMTQAGGGARGYVNYRCTGRHGGGVCPAPARISFLRADAYVERHFLEWAKAANLSGRDAPAARDVELAVQALAEATVELDAYRDETLVSVIGAVAYRAGLDERARRVDAAREQLQVVRRTSAPLLGLLTVTDEWDDLDLAERRGLLFAAIDAVFVRRAHLRGRAPFEDRLHICWAGSAPADLPGRGRSGLRPFVFPSARPDPPGVASAE